MFRETAEAPIGEALPKVDPRALSLNGFISWMETKKPKEAFYWASCTNCAMAQWWKETQENSRDPYGSALRTLGRDVNYVVLNSCVDSWWRGKYSTFGNTLKALKAYRATL